MDLLKFAKERVGSVISKKVGAAAAGVYLVETWPQAAVLCAYIIAQAYCDSKK